MFGGEVPERKEKSAVNFKMSVTNIRKGFNFSVHKKLGKQNKYI
jgi:hypothetical protein